MVNSSAASLLQLSAPVSFEHSKIKLPKNITKFKNSVRVAQNDEMFQQNKRPLKQYTYSNIIPGISSNCYGIVWLTAGPPQANNGKRRGRPSRRWHNAGQVPSSLQSFDIRLRPKGRPGLMMHAAGTDNKQQIPAPLG